MRVSKIMLLKVFVFTIICLVFTVALGMKLANSRLFADTYDMKAEFEDATGVLDGDAVKIAGVDVGRVTGTEIKDGKAVLSFNVDKDVELPTDSEVAIRWRNVLGQRFVYIYPGDDTEHWDEGDTIPLSHTNDVADIGEFLNRVGPILKAIDPEQANAFLDAVNTALANNEENVQALLDAGASLASDLSERDGHIARTIENADTIMEAFASQDDQIASIIDDLDNVSGVLARRTDDVNQLVTNFADVQDQLDELLATSGSNIDATIGALDSVTDTLASNQKNLGRSLRSAPAGISNYFQTSAWGEWFNVRLVELVLQDGESNDLARVRENEDLQRCESCGGKGEGGTEQVSRDNDDGSSAGDGSGATEAPSENVGSLLRYSLTGDER
jgi:phospholipid/cholesterol/gamma-HCH transport system substrate-binding protein